MRCVSGFRLPKDVIASGDAAMVRGPQNYDQETWRQFPSKFRPFISIPEQFGPYLVNNIHIQSGVDSCVSVLYRFKHRQEF